MSAGIEEPNGLLTLGEGGRREPNIPATVTELVEGIVARRQNGWPSVEFDLMAMNSLAAPLFSAGFYYKTFMGPAPRILDVLRAVHPPRSGAWRGGL